jgi:hypothetical protein
VPEAGRRSKASVYATVNIGKSLGLALQGFRLHTGPEEALEQTAVDMIQLAANHTMDDLVWVAGRVKNSELGLQLARASSAAHPRDLRGFFAVA